MWHNGLEDVSALILAIYTEAWTIQRIGPHRPLMAAFIPTPAIDHLGILL